MGNEKRGTYDFFYRVNPERTISFHGFIPNRNKTELNQECIQEKKIIMGSREVVRKTYALE